MAAAPSGANAPGDNSSNSSGDTISFLLNPPSSPVHMSVELDPNGPGSAPAWDKMLTAIDWTQQDWHNYENLDYIPWGQLTRNTVDLIAAAWDLYDALHHPESRGLASNPANAEQLRRLPFPHQDPAASQQTQGVKRLFTQNPPGLNRPQTTLGVDPHPPLTQKEDDDIEMKQFELENGPEGFFTIGYEIEFLVAATSITADDPHPNDTRWLDADLIHDSVNSIKFKDRVLRTVANVLNNEAGVVCVIKDEDEDNPLHTINMEKLDKLVAETDPAGPGPAAPGTGSPTPPPSDAGLVDPAAVEAVAQMCVDEAETLFFRAEDNMRIHQATNADIYRYVKRISTAPAVVALADPDRIAVAERVRRRLRVIRHREQRDALHVALPGMKHRYRSWSVSEVKFVRPDLVRTEHYEQAPSTTARPPTDAYKWLAVKVSSPVLNGGEIGAIEAALERVCRTLRRRFRAHRDLPQALPLSTQVVVSHTQGFSLVELKKFATLARLLEHSLRKLHKHERADPAAWRAAATFGTWSALGAASHHDTEWLMANAQAPAWRALPRPEPTTRAFLQAQMAQHVPADEIFARGTVHEEVFYRGLWLYSTVEELARGLNPDRADIRTGVMIKAAGNGQHTAADRDEVDDERRPLPFVEIDRRRGALEFRYMQQSLEPFHILSWSAVCARLVSAAKNTEPWQFYDLVLGIIRGRPIFDALGIPDKFAAGFQEGIARSSNGFFELPNRGRVNYFKPFWSPM
ncbi:hypothetical protein F4810DRAFT_717373 [Camillea tinctor]|nr:hypothetical protein F4810DRAFT_717373 [Camillea tinctor]